MRLFGSANCVTIATFYLRFCVRMQILLDLFDSTHCLWVFVCSCCTSAVIERDAHTTGAWIYGEDKNQLQNPPTSERVVAFCTFQSYLLAQVHINVSCAHFIKVGRRILSRFTSYKRPSDRGFLTLPADDMLNGAQICWVFTKRILIASMSLINLIKRNYDREWFFFTKMDQILNVLMWLFISDLIKKNCSA